jgi:hypothetical protein
MKVIRHQPEGKHFNRVMRFRERKEAQSYPSKTAAYEF